MEAPSPGGRRRLPPGSEEQALGLIAREAEARLAAKRAARAEAREIRMKELERQQKEVEERPDKDFNEKGARTASSLSAATLASLGGSSSRRGSGDTSISVDTEASIREIKDSLAEVEEKYKKAMVSNAQLDNEKTNFMYQVDTLKDVLLELEEQLAETHRQFEEKSKEFEREKHSHRILQIQYNEMKESLQQKEEMLMEIRQLQQKQENNAREISDLQETIEWKDKKIGALERQKEFFDCVRTERDELRDEVAVLKEELKRHGIVLSSDLSPNGGTLDGPYHEGLVDSSSRGTEDTAPGLKTTGDGPLGRANEVKMKNECVEKVEEGKSLQSSEAVECEEEMGVQGNPTALVEEKTLHAEAGSTGDRHDDPTFMSAATLEQISTDAGAQSAKRDPSGDDIDGSGEGFDPSSVTKELGNSSGDATEGLIVLQVERLDTLQGQRGFKTKGERDHIQENETLAVQAAGKRESCSEVFQDAVEFVGQKTCHLGSRAEDSHVQEEHTGATIDEMSAKPPMESKKGGCQVQGVLQELGRNLDAFFDAVSENAESSSNKGDQMGEESQPKHIEQDLEVEGVSAEVQQRDRPGLTPSEVIVEIPGEVAGTEEGAHNTSINAVVSEEFVGSSVDATMGRVDQAGRDAPVGGEQRFEAEINQAEMSTALGSQEEKSDEEEPDVESVGSKPHSEDGEFYECSDEEDTVAVAAVEATLGDQSMKSSQESSRAHHESTEASVDLSRHTKEEEMYSITSQQVVESGVSSDVDNGICMASKEPVLPDEASGQAMTDIRGTQLDGNWQQAMEDQAQLVQRDDNGVEVCRTQTKSDGEKDQGKQGAKENDTPGNEESGTLEEATDRCRLENLESKTDPEGLKIDSGGPDGRKANLEEKACEPELKVGDLEDQTPDNGDSFDFDDEEGQVLENGRNLSPAPALGQEPGKECGNELQMVVAAQISDTEIAEQDDEMQRLPKDVLAEGKDTHQEGGASLEATEQKPEVPSHPDSAETSSSDSGKDSEQFTESTGVENAFADSAEQPEDLENAQTYSKEDTLDRGVKRGKGKNKEDCLLS